MPKNACVDQQVIENARNDCTSDDECLQNGRKFCDADPSCFGIMWNEDVLTEPLKMCKSTTLVPDTDGGRTILKGIYTSILC